MLLKAERIAHKACLSGRYSLACRIVAKYANLTPRQNRAFALFLRVLDTPAIFRFKRCIAAARGELGFQRDGDSWNIMERHYFGGRVTHYNTRLDAMRFTNTTWEPGRHPEANGLMTRTRVTCPLSR